VIDVMTTMCWTDQCSDIDTAAMTQTPTLPAEAPTPSAEPTARPSGSARVRLTALTALAPVSWGTTYAVTTEMLPPDRPLFAALLRSLPAGLIALALTRRLPHRDWWWRAGVLGALNIGVFLPLLFVSAGRLPGGVAATLHAIQPIVVAGLAVVILGEALTAWRLSWAVAGLVGVGMVMIGPDAALDTVGIVAGLSGATAMALGVTLTKRWGRPPGVGPMVFAGWQLTAGGLVLLPLALVAEGAPPSIDAEAGLGYLWLGSVGALLAYTLWFRGIGKLPVAATALLALLSPLVAAAIGIAVLHESVTVVQGVGFALTLTALVAGQIPAPRRITTTKELLA
jgi:probable blue pigment (indigoidine) exporter